MFKRGTLEIDEFVKKAETLVSSIFDHKDFSKERVLAKLLINASENIRLQEEVVLRKLSSVDEIKETLILLDKVEEKKDFVFAVRQYGKDVKGECRKPVQTCNWNKDNSRRVDREIECWGCGKKGHLRSQCSNRENRICWTCNKKGHLSRNCGVNEQVKCFGCGEPGHIRRECMKVRCFRCNGQGHKSEECRKNVRNGYKDYELSSRRDQRSQRNRYNYFNTIEMEDEENQYDEEVEERELESKSPNGRAPSREELVGASH